MGTAFGLSFGPQVANTATRATHNPVTWDADGEYLLMKRRVAGDCKGA